MEHEVLTAMINAFPSHYYSIYKVYDARDSYIFAIKRNDADRDSGAVMDPFHIINKKTLQIKGFLPHQDPKLYRYAIQHPIPI